MIASLRLYLGVMFFASSFFAFAQEFSISGKVVDSNNNPIEFTNVIIFIENESEFLKGTSTDDQGFFKLDKLTSATYVVKISFIGLEEFEQKIILTGDLNLKTIQLNEIPESLSEVTIIGKKPTFTRKPDRLIFNIENTALTEGSTLGVLKSTPGVIVSEGGINIKSAPATVFINNRRVQLTSGELIQFLESAPANSIKSIEVITNPPASYDADSGSVINIIMSKNLVTGYRGSIQTNYTQGVFPRFNTGTSHYFKNDKVNLNLNYSYTNQKINLDEDSRVNFLDNNFQVEEIWGSDINRNTWSETHNLNLNFDYFINDKNTLSLTSTGLYIPYYKYQNRNNTNITDENSSFLSRFTADNLSRDNKYNIGSDISFRHEFENDASFTLSGHYTIYDYERNQNVFSVFFDQNNTFEDSSEFNTLANQDTQIITAKADYSLPLNETSNFDIGVKVSSVITNSDITRLDIINGTEVVNTDNTDAFKYDENVFAAYSNYSKSTDKWDINIGLRVGQTNIKGESLVLSENNTQNYLEWFPNASISYGINESTRIKVNYKRSILRPSYTDLNPFTTFLNENTVIVGNPFLTPTFSDHFVIGINFLEYFTVEAYYINHDGQINQLPRQDNTTNIVSYTPLNLDKTVDFGFDFSVNFYITNRWSLYALTSFYNISQEANIDGGFIELSRWSNYSILSNNISFLKDKSLDASLNITYGNKNIQELATWDTRIVSDLSITKSLWKKKAVISLTVQDLFNKQDWLNTVNYLNQSSSDFRNFDNRFIRLGFRYNFGNTTLKTNKREITEEEEKELDRLKSSAKN